MSKEKKELALDQFFQKMVQPTRFQLCLLLCSSLVTDFEFAVAEIQASFKPKGSKHVSLSKDVQHGTSSIFHHHLSSC